jgi:hypothetical protein
LLRHRVPAHLPRWPAWRKLARVSEEDGAAGIDYRHLMQEALTGVVRGALRQVAAEGLPGDHHFLITFRTDWPGVELPAVLARRHPREMTIVVQHQYWNLEVREDAFAVTLRFGGAPQRLSVPFAALTTFVDPSVPFGLRLMASADSAEPEAEPAAEVPNAAAPPAEASAVHESRAGAATVVDFEAFRKRE